MTDLLLPDMHKMAAQRAAQEAQINHFMATTSQLIYTGLVIEHLKDHEDVDLATGRRLAILAREASPYLAEAYGMVQISQKDAGQQPS